MASSYIYDKADGKKGEHTLDAHIHTPVLKPVDSSRVVSWLEKAQDAVVSNSCDRINIDGVVFEVR